jgi:hypothetical protein
MSALDFVMDRIALTFTVIGTERFDDRTIVAARSELAALRRRAEEAEARGRDLELMLRLKMYGYFPFERNREGNGSWTMRDKNGRGVRWVADDGTGLPMLDDAARAALRGEGDRAR